jgi:hypothetical protein
MTDQHNDIELIMELAEGSLPANEAALIEASLDDDAREELAEQRLALVLLSDISAESLTASERSSLRSAVMAEINLEPISPPVAAKAPWYENSRYLKALPALGAAAAIVFVVGIGLNSVGGSSDEAAPTAEMAEAEQTVATEAVAAAEMADSAVSGDRVSDTEATAATTAMTEAPAETTAAAEEASTDGAVDFAVPMVSDTLGELDLSDLTALALLVEDGAKRLKEYTPYAAFRLPDAATPQGLVCWTDLLELINHDDEIAYLGRAAIGGEDAEVYRIIDPQGTATIYVYLAAECSIAAIVET